MQKKNWITVGLASLVALVVSIGAIACSSDTTTNIPNESSDCNPNYSGGCVPNVSYDLDCADIGFPVEVVGTDEYRLDRDGDGHGCESS